MLEKEGCSNLQEQQKVLRPVIRLLRQYKLVVIGDREFHSIELANWLDRLKISFVFRQKQDTTFRENREEFKPLSSVPIRPGIRLFFPNIKLTQKRGFSDFGFWILDFRLGKKNIYGSMEQSFRI